MSGHDGGGRQRGKGGQGQTVRGPEDYPQGILSEGGGGSSPQRDRAAAVRQKRGPSQLAGTHGRCPRGQDPEGQVSG